MTYTPSQELLDRYARLLVDYALGGGNGIEPGDVVQITSPDSAKPLYVATCRAVWQAGGQVLDGYYPDDQDDLPVSRVRFDNATDEQLDFFPDKYFRGLIDQTDHTVHIMAESNPNALQGVAPAKLLRLRRSRRLAIEWRNAKENAGEYSWTIGLYPTPAMAAEAGLSMEEYWDQVKLACFLDDEDPVARWRQVNAEIDKRAAWLNSLEIDRLHVEGEDADLWVTVGEKRKWIGGGGANIPSFEVFTSPDWRGTEGWIRFSEPLYIYGSLIKGVELQFKEGLVVKATATENESLLKEMVATKNADRVGEFSMTDAGLSRITRFMANTLYDENMGGPFGNTHVAVGMAIKQCYDGDTAGVSEAEWERLGFNDSVVHTDIVSTTDRTVTAQLRDGSEQVIYSNGNFTGGVTVTYVPAQEYLERYAQLLVDYALGEGEGISQGDVVRVAGAESAKPLYVEVCRAVWRSGGHVLHDYTPPDDAQFNVGRDFYELASDEQLDFFAERYWRGVMDQADHLVALISEDDPHALSGVEPARIMRRRQAFLPVIGWQQAKEGEGRFTWTAGLYGTEAMAAEAEMPIEEYWRQIVAACYLDEADLLDRWRAVNDQIAAHCEALNSLAIDRLHVEGENADLWLTLGERRKWIGGGGRNIPSFEVFTTPDWRGTEGWIRFTEPLYVYGSLIKGIELGFREGRVVSSRATENENLLKEMIATEGADRLGEFSLTDSRLSRITRFMASTLYDENVGGRFGNTHLALGLGLRHTYDGDPSQVSEAEWEELGFNASTVHTDIVQTSDRTVTAVLRDGTEQVIYADGKFQHA